MQVDGHHTQKKVHTMVKWVWTDYFKMQKKTHKMESMG